MICDMIFVKGEPAHYGITGGYSGFVSHWCCRAHGMRLAAQDIAFFAGRYDVSDDELRANPPSPEDCADCAAELVEQERRDRREASWEMRVWRRAQRYFRRLGQALIDRDDGDYW